MATHAIHKMSTFTFWLIQVKSLLLDESSWVGFDILDFWERAQLIYNKQINKLCPLSTRIASDERYFKQTSFCSNVISWTRSFLTSTMGCWYEKISKKQPETIYKTHPTLSLPLHITLEFKTLLSWFHGQPQLPENCKYCPNPSKHKLKHNCCGEEFFPSSTMQLHRWGRHFMKMHLDTTKNLMWIRQVLLRA